MRKSRLHNLPARPTIIAAMAFLLLVGWSDYITGPNFSFALFYLPSIAVVAWFGGKWLGIIAAIEAAIIWFTADYLGGTLSVEVHIWNAFVRLCFFTITAFFSRSTRLQMMSLQHNLNDKTKEAHEFHRLLPICSSCKRIRDELGNWHIMEEYIKERTEVELSQSVCPDCAGSFR